jgi:hypothetical protein
MIQESNEVMMQQDVVRYNILRSLVPSLVFVGTIRIAFIDPQDTPFAWSDISDFYFFAEEISQTMR